LIKSDQNGIERRYTSFVPSYEITLIKSDQNGIERNTFV